MCTHTHTHARTHTRTHTHTWFSNATTSSPFRKFLSAGTLNEAFLLYWSRGFPTPALPLPAPLSDIAAVRACDQVWCTACVYVCIRTIVSSNRRIFPWAIPEKYA